MQAQPWSNKLKQSEHLPIKGNSAFIFTHKPSNWELYKFIIEGDDKRKKAIEKPILLPLFTSLRITGGCNGVRDGVKPDPSIAIAKANQEGLTVLHPNQYDYLRLYPARTGTYHTDIWTKIDVLGGQCVFEFDHEGFANWRRELVVKGIIKPPHKHFVQLLQMSRQRAIDRLALDQHIPERALKLKQKQEDIRAIMDFKERLLKDGIEVYKF
jgi:hypothetical protein